MLQAAVASTRTPSQVNGLDFRSQGSQMGTCQSQMAPFRQPNIKPEFPNEWREQSVAEQDHVHSAGLALC